MDYIIVDLEATCQENNRDFENEIIEIGAVKLNDSFKYVDEFDIFVKPKLNPILSDFCKNLTSIKQEDVDGAVSFTEALDKFIYWIDSN